MRAAMWEGPGLMSVRSVDDPRCPTDGVLLKVLACGICGTDVRSFYAGDRRISPPWLLGHEISGEVFEVGEEAVAELDGIQVGTRVHCISTFWCGRCRLCRSGRENLCAVGELMGFDYPGAYAELVVVPPIGLKNLFRIPKALSAAHATFADPLSDVICGHKDLGITLDETVVVVGAGPIGAAHAALARLQGAGLVMLLERASSRLALVESVLGRERISYVDVSVGDGLATIREATDEVGADVVIVACSNPEAQQQALEMAAPRGRVLFFGGLPKGTTHIPFESNVLHYREVQVHGSYASRHKDQVLALEMLEQNAADLRDLISETVPLESTADVFARIRSGEVLKVVVEP